MFLLKFFKCQKLPQHSGSDKSVLKRSAYSFQLYYLKMQIISIKLLMINHISTKNIYHMKGMPKIFGNKQSVNSTFHKFSVCRYFHSIENSFII